jgi:tetratricopeptide (TPR) repeat protein
MEKKYYAKAIEVYTEAIETKRDFIVLYTNRALAYIKLEKYEEAMKDCTKLLDYCDCFEDGYMKSKNLTFKAFLRRAHCQKELKNYEEALKDVEEALLID